MTGIRTVDLHGNGCSSLSPSGAIRNNTLVRNSGDAIHLECGQWAVGGNLMKFNGGLGINVSGPNVQVTDERQAIARIRSRRR